jgi:cytochrome b6-f complex iron-sulfur subunit
MTAKQPVTRRDFLALCARCLLAASGLLGFGGLARFLGYQGPPPTPVDFDLGPASNFASGTRTVVPQAKVLLIHDENGLRAISLACPHLGCEVTPDESGFACPCHGSRFDPDGRLIRGPANAPLALKEIVQTADGRILLHTQ